MMPLPLYIGLVFLVVCVAFLTVYKVVTGDDGPKDPPFFA